MASKNPFNIANSPTVAPIPCLDCGNNMHCVRRMPAAKGEQQLFMCAACGNCSERIVGLLESDDAVQRSAEKSAGMKLA